MKYRREIDGLRALAVVPVMLFHAGIGLFSGGFVGVDIFFVISGYLITSIILAEQQAGTFTILNFYERRARRILPALFFVMFACLPFAWVWLLPVDLWKFSQSLMAVPAFASNVLFWLSAGYFETSAELKPLLHTWSLAVEEQYYLFFPVFLMLAWRFGRRWIVGSLAVIALASLAAAQWASAHSPDAAFYLLPTRGWELLIGAFVAFHFARTDRPEPSAAAAELGALAGLLLIAYAIFGFDHGTPFPSLYTMVPTAGAALIILFASPRTLAGRLLGNRAMVGIGLISYSAYLWHQPLFAFARHWSIGDPGRPMLAGLSVLACVLAYFSWKYIEAPFRSSQRFSRAQVFTYGAAGSALFVAAGLAGYLTMGFVSLKTTKEHMAVLSTAQASPRRAMCHTQGADYLKPANACEYNQGSLSWATFGDSHGVELTAALADELKGSGARLKQFTFSGCHPTYGRIEEGRLGNCSRWTREAAEYIGESATIRNVVVAYRIHASLFGYHEDVYPALPNLVRAEDRAARWKSYVDVSRYFVSKGKNVILVLQAPELPKSLDGLLFRASDQRGDIVGMKRAWWDERSKYVMSRLNELPPQVKVIDTAKIFCDEARCLAAKDGIGYYFDDNHISMAGARLVAGQIVNPADAAHPLFAAVKVHRK